MSLRMNISLEWRGQQVDYQVPTGITFGRLTELMQQALTGARLPESWILGLKDKDIEINATDLIKNLPIGNGDVFCILPTTEKQEFVNESL